MGLSVFPIELHSMYILDINPLPNTWFTNIFFHSIGGLSHWIMVSFSEHKLFSLILSRVVWLLASNPKGHCQEQCP